MIVFTGFDLTDIYGVESDGSGLKKLVAGGSRTWSWAAATPDAKHLLAFDSSAGEFWRMNPDGSGLTQITNVEPTMLYGGVAATFSPDGSTFVGNYDFATKLSFAKLDNSGFTNLTPSGGAVSEANNSSSVYYSPDGSKLAFGGKADSASYPGVCVCNVDGSGLTEIVAGSGGDTYDVYGWFDDRTLLVQRDVGGSISYVLKVDILTLAVTTLYTDPTLTYFDLEPVSLSPDRRQLAFLVVPTNGLAILDLATGAITPVITPPGGAPDPSAPRVNNAMIQWATFPFPPVPYPFGGAGAIGSGPAPAAILHEDPPSTGMGLMRGVLA